MAVRFGGRGEGLTRDRGRLHLVGDGEQGDKTGVCT